MEPSVPSIFEYVGGRPALDFTNTLGGSREAPREKFVSYEELLRWARGSGLVDEEQERRLRAASAKTPAVAAEVLERAIQLREALFTLFAGRTRSERVSSEALTRVNRELAHALSHQRLRERNGQLLLEWEGALALDAMLWPVVRDAAELLSSDKLHRVKICEASHEGRCDWLFL